MLKKGFIAMLPVMTGVIPFGLVMGTVASNAELSLFETMFMNIWIFAGASQLVAVDLLMKESQLIVIILTCWVINLRMLLYSAYFSTVFRNEKLWKKIVGSYCLTDQSYAVYISKEQKLKTDEDGITYYLGSAICMVSFWQISVLLGYFFGNIAPSSLNLDFAIPLCFVALAVPSIKNKNYIIVAVFSSLASLVFYSIPYNLGLLLSAFLAISLGAFLTRKGEIA